jgi:hypothetical protein
LAVLVEVHLLFDLGQKLVAGLYRVDLVVNIDNVLL